MVTIGATKQKNDTKIKVSTLVIDYDIKKTSWNQRCKEIKEELEKSKGTENELIKNEDFHRLLDEFNKDYKDSLVILPPYEGDFLGREEELKGIRDTISKTLEPTRVILGSAGTGKTTLVREATRRINAGQMENKMGYNLVCVELSLLALLDEGESKFTSMLAEIIPRILKLEQEARVLLNDENIKFVLFIDEVHTLTKAVQKENGESNGADVLKRHIKPEIGTLILIGATTVEEYRKYIEPNLPLKERFSDKTILPEFTNREVEKISLAHWDYLMSLRKIKNSKLPIEWIRYIIKTNATEDLMSSEPRKTKQFLGSLDSYSFNENQVPTLDMIKKVFWTAKHITPEVNPDIDETFKAIDTRLKGQYGAKYLAKRAIKARYGRLTKSYNKPYLSFLALGPTGVGKTEFANILNDNIFGGKGAIVDMDCSDYAYLENGVEKFLREAGEKIGESEYAVFLIDEVEKAIPSKRNQGVRSSLRDIFLGLTGKGVLKYTPKSGGADIELSLSKTIMVFTSNAGYEIFEGNDKFSDNTITANTPQNKIEQILHSVGDELKENLHAEYNFAREFFGRLDAVLPFTSLTEADAIEITERFLDETIQLAHEQENINILIDDKIEYDHELIRGIDEGKTREFHPLAVTLSSYLANMKESSKGGARQVATIFSYYIDNILSDIKLKRKDLSEMTIRIYPELLDPYTGERLEDEEIQEQVRQALVSNRKEDIEIVYEEV